MKRFLPILLLIICLCISSCRAENKSSVSFFAMDTYMSIEAYGDNSAAVENAKELVLKLEKSLAVNNEQSEIYALNHGKSAKLSAETCDLIRFALEICEKTDGALDPTIYPVLRAWGFTAGEYRVVEKNELSELLKAVGSEKVKLKGNEITLEAGAMLDLGAVAKGYASEKCAEILEENGVKSALINLGGNIQLVGSRPNGESWKIGVANPKTEGNSEYVGVLSVSDCAVVTSGNYQRFFVENGKEYGHIINPKTGIPVENDLLSVTVISLDGKLCDALSTALFVMGAENAEKYWRENRDFEAVFITKNGEVRVTSGIFDKFKLDESAGYKLVKIDR